MIDKILSIDSIESLFKALKGNEKIKDRANLLLNLRSWLTGVSDFDPLTGSALPVDMVKFLNVVARSLERDGMDEEIKDRIYHIASHVDDAIRAITGNMRSKILREHTLLPIYAAREVDSNSIRWLSRKPGRTLREKLSGKPYINAVRRRSSLDTSENRLLKAFLSRLEYLLIERQNVFGSESEETCERLLALVQRWLQSEETDEIGDWANLSPNNTLLQDKRYRKVWNGWLWSQSIDENIYGDHERLGHDITVAIYWNLLSLLHRTGQFRSVQQPVMIDYDHFGIKSIMTVEGYLFPIYSSDRIVGKVESIDTEKRTGIIDGLFFHANFLVRDLNFEDIHIGDQLSFEFVNNNKSTYANKIDNFINPKKIRLELLSDYIFVVAEKYEFYVKIWDDHIAITRNLYGYDKKFDMTPSTTIDVAEELFSLVLNGGFDSCQKMNYKDRSDSVRSDLSVVDLCSIRPKFITDTSSQKSLPFRLLQQCWAVEKHDSITVDCGEANAICFCDDIVTVSMPYIFSSGSDLSGSLKSGASMLFMRKIREYISAKIFCYLVPDWVNDFDLENIRKSVNFYYQNSIPLPKSIAAIFAWQSSKKFEQDKLKDNDFVLILESFDRGFSITPVQGIYSKELFDILPESNGFYWERHPTSIINQSDIHLKMTKNLTEDGCQNADELIRLFGFDGLVDDAGKISFVGNDRWYHLPATSQKVLDQDQIGNVISAHVFTDALKSLNKSFDTSSVFILPIGDAIKKPEIPRYYQWLGSSWSPIKGCRTSILWQERAGCIPLWRDHLPELSIRIFNKEGGYYENFFLVKDATVTPQRGRQVSIPVVKNFTLPEGKPYYRFPLVQGKGNHELQFEAFLKSPAFPLQSDTVCKLDMTYTYGADDPYQLNFIPLNPEKAGFKFIHVEWCSSTEKPPVNLSDLPVPSFPSRKSWADFQRFPNMKDTEFVDLLDQTRRELKKVENIVQFGRIEAPVGQWKNDKKGKKFCFADNTFIHESMFERKSFENLPNEGENISFYKIEQNGKFSGLDISLVGKEPEKCFLQKSIRFQVQTIWNNGHSLSESDAPDYFRSIILKGINDALVLMKSEDTPVSLKEELFFFLSCLHKDAPSEVIDKLVMASMDIKQLRRYYRNIAFAIGSAELSWQQELLGNAINSVSDELTQSSAMEIFAIAFWRVEKLIFTLTADQIVTLTNRLVGCLKTDLQRLISEIVQYRIDYLCGKGRSKVEAIDIERRYQMSVLCKHLELLLALLRSRDFENENVKGLLSPDKVISKKYITLIDDISKVLTENKFELVSRINIQIEKPEHFNNFPDLLYALRMFLTGESGTSTIIITGINDEE